MTKASGACENGSCVFSHRWFVSVRVVPQKLTGPNGEDFGNESPNAGRNKLVCSKHLAVTVDALYALPIRLPNAPVTVRPS